MKGGSIDLWSGQGEEGGKRMKGERRKGRGRGGSTDLWLGRGAADSGRVTNCRPLSRDWPDPRDTSRGCWSPHAGTLSCSLAGISACDTQRQQSEVNHQTHEHANLSRNFLLIYVTNLYSSNRVRRPTAMS